MDLLFIDRSTKLESIFDLDHRARGGMVSSLVILTNLLAQMGHNVTVASDIRNGGVTEHGVYWAAGSLDELTRNTWDVLVTNRGIGDGYPIINARHRVLWTHDLPHNGFIDEPRMIRAFSATVFMSHYAEKVWRTFYRDIGRSFLIPNGVDKARFFPNPDKDLDYIIFASAPNRGLKRLPLILDAIRTRVRPGIYLKAYSNMGLMHPNEVASKDNGNGDGFELEYQALRESSVELHDPIPQQNLAAELGRAGLMLIPTDYPEICSNSILQALASGVPVITTGGLGSAGEWIRHGRNGMLTIFRPQDYMIYQIEMCRNAVEVLVDEKRHRKMIQNASNTKNICSWEEIAWQWGKMLRRL